MSQDFSISNGKKNFYVDLTKSEDKDFLKQIESMENFINQTSDEVALSS